MFDQHLFEEIVGIKVEGACNGCVLSATVIDAVVMCHREVDIFDQVVSEQLIPGRNNWFFRETEGQVGCESLDRESIDCVIQGVQV